MPSTSDFLRDLQSRGRYCFSTEEAVQALGRSTSATRAVLRRLRAKGEVADPYRGFHVIVPPEYRRLGSLPADQFVPELLRHLGEPYYATLLTAAAYHGAAHQKPHVFQVMVRKRRRPVACGAVRIQFVARGNMDATTVVERNTSRGVLRVASAEATALELVGYPEHAGGLDNVATVLAELAESLDAATLAVEARRAPCSWVQRLGYLLALADASGPADVLESVVESRASFPVALAPSVPATGCPSDRRWNVVVNVSVEPDL